MGEKRGVQPKDAVNFRIRQSIFSEPSRDIATGERVDVWRDIAEMLPEDLSKLPKIPERHYNITIPVFPEDRQEPTSRTPEPSTSEKVEFENS